MPNFLDSNHGEKIAQSIGAGFESSRVTSKTVDTQTLQGMHNSSTGSVVYTKRPTAYKAVETPRGDITSVAANSIAVGQVASTVQDLITVHVEWDTVEQALQLNQLDQLLNPIGEEVCNTLESRVNGFIVKNAGLTVGNAGSSIKEWSDVARAQAMLEAIGAPKSGKKYMQLSNYDAINLAGKQTGLAADGRVNTAWKDATVTSQLAGLTVLKSNALTSIRSGSSADRVGAIAAAPIQTYQSAKDTMRMALAVTGFGAGATISAGETIKVTGKYHTNPANRETILDGTGQPVNFSLTVVEDVTLDGAGGGTVQVTNAAIFDAVTNGQFDNISEALASGDELTLEGLADSFYKPSLFYHDKAVTLATIELPKLYAQDVIYKSKDGVSMRFSRGSNFEGNSNKLRVDLMYALGINNPLHAGRAFGV